MPALLERFFIYFWELSFHEQSERAKQANVVSGMVENLRRKKFSPARIGVGGCRLSICDRDFVK
jgi:hypothetical protein